MTTSVDGLVSGLDSSSTITQLMAVERQPQNRLVGKKTASESLISVYQLLNTRLLAVKDASAALTGPSGWQNAVARTSDATIATASTSKDAVGGSLTFTVERLATAQSVVSAGTVNSAAAVVAPPNSHFLVSAVAGRGISQLVGSADLSLGAHTVTVTQASGAATQTGFPLATSITIGAGATLEVALNGSTTTTQTVTLAAGTYSRAQIALMISAASGGSMNATVANDGNLKLSTAREGTAAQLAITGGSALASLGLGIGSVTSGSDAIVDVDGQLSTISDVNPGSQVTLAVPGGATLSATLASGLRAGTSKVTNVNLGDGTLTAVTRAINGAGTGMAATTVQVAAGVYRMQMAATATGANGALTSNLSVFTPSMGVMQTLTQGTDAQLTVGSGPAAYTITSATNQAEIMAGVTITLAKADPAPVTVSVADDASAAAAKVNTFVAAVNSALTFITSQSKYDATSKTGGPLLSDSATRVVQRRLFDALGTTQASTIGLSVLRDGTLGLDQGKFLSAYRSDPVAVQAIFNNATSGVATRYEGVGKSATDSVTGLISVAISGKKALSATLTDQIANWDTRLALREATLKRQFSSLEVSLGTLKNQSAWLAGQIASLSRAG